MVMKAQKKKKNPRCWASRELGLPYDTGGNICTAMPWGKGKGEEKRRERGR